MKNQQKKVQFCNIANDETEDDNKEDSKGESEEDLLGSSVNGTFINHSVVIDENADADTFAMVDSDYLQALQVVKLEEQREIDNSNMIESGEG